MHAFANRRLHLVCALTLVGIAVARIVAEASGVAALAPTALRVCTGSALLLGAAVVALASRMRPHGFARCWIALVPCAIGAAIQIARMRRVDVAMISTQPYR